MKARHIHRFTVGAVILVLLCVACICFSVVRAFVFNDVSGVASSGTFTELAEYETARVVRVVDGDTLVVTLNGEEQRVRLIGIDCPESVSAHASENTAEGMQASNHTKQLVSSGDTVYLETDVSQTDKYGRLLRYVWLGVPIEEKDCDYAAEYMLNARIVADGYAEAVEYEPDTAWAQVFEELEAEAREQGLGISSTF